MIAEKDVQIVSDMRLIAMALMKRWGADSRYRAEAQTMGEFIGACEHMLAHGPASGHHIIERTATIQQVQSELHKSVFGHAPLKENSNV